MSFAKAVQKMISKSTDLVIGLVVRWDGDDSLVWTFWSVGPAQQMDSKASPVELAPFSRYRRDFYGSGGGFKDTLVVNRFSLGLHAEEVLLLSWENLLQQVRKKKGPDYYPKKVEMVLSKSPCHGPKGSSPLIMTLKKGKFGFSHTGCSYKLRDFMRTQPVESWSLKYFNLAGSKVSSSDSSRHLAGQQYWEQKSLLDEGYAFERLTWPMRVPGNFKKAPVNVRRDKVWKSIEKKYKPKFKKLEPLHNKMRTMSVAQAQHGIAILEALVHVDVERILRKESIVKL